MIATVDCPTELRAEQIDKIRERALSREQLEAVRFVAHIVEAHWETIPLESREKLRDFVSTFDEWARNYRPKSVREVLRSVRAAFNGDNLRYSMNVSRIITAVRKHCREDEARGRELAGYLRHDDPEVIRQMRLSTEEFESGQFVELSAEQIRSKTW